MGSTRCRTMLRSLQRGLCRIQWAQAPPASTLSGRFVPVRRMGIMDTLGISREQREQNEFKKTLEDLASRESYHIDAFLQSLEDSTKMMGIKGLKTKMPLAGDQAGEVENLIKILKAFPERLRTTPNVQIRPQEKKAIASAAGVEGMEVNQVLNRFNHSAIMWMLVKELQRTGQALPESVEEAQEMMARSQTTRSRAMLNTAKSMKNKMKKTKGRGIQAR